MQNKVMALVLVVLLLLVACSQEYEDAIVLTTEIQIEETEPESNVEEAKSITEDLSPWRGFYSEHYFLTDGYINIDFTVCEEADNFFGYIYLKGSKKRGGEESDFEWSERVRTRVETDGERLLVYYLETFPVDAEYGQILKEAQPGELLFSIEAADREDIFLVTWDDAHLIEDEIWQYRVYRRDQVLAVEIEDETDRLFFLRSQGIHEKDEPFYSYYDEEGKLHLEIYYDIEQRNGAGISYGVNGYGDPVVSGFGIGDWTEEPWQDLKYVVDDRGPDLSGEEGYEAVWEYNEDGQPLRYQSDVIITGWGDPYKGYIMEIEFSYRDDGTLRKKKCQYNHRLFGTTRQSESHYFDAQERLVYVSAYITHGFLEDFYIYEGDDKEPSWRLTLDHMGVLAAEDVFIKYK